MPNFDKNKFSLKYMVLGDKENPKKDWFKALGLGIRFVIIIGLCYIIYRGADALFPKSKPSVQQIKVERGGQATIIQKTESKRWYMFFVEPFIGAKTDTKGEGRADVGVRTGIRVEF